MRGWPRHAPSCGVRERVLAEGEGEDGQTHNDNKKKIIALKGAIRNFYNLLIAPRTVSNTYAQVGRAQSCANHVQHIERLSRAKNKHINRHTHRRRRTDRCTPRSKPKFVRDTERQRQTQRCEESSEDAADRRAERTKSRRLSRPEIAGMQRDRDAESD